mgnify:CR=1 FL=1
MVRRAVEPEDLRRMIQVEKMTYQEIADAVGLTVSGVQQAARRYNLLQITNRLSHRWAKPWRVTKEHNDSRVTKYLRDLSSAAQGRKLDEYNLNTALTWARDLVERGLDVDYDRNMGPNEASIQGGYFYRPANKGHWHIKHVLEVTEEALRTGKPYTP